MIGSVGFGALAACAILSALFVVRSHNLVRAALWLGVTLLVTAALYAMAGASFLAGVQVLLYVGGVVTLMIFGVMVTRRHEGGLAAPAEGTNHLRAALAAGALFALVAWAIHETPDLDRAIVPPPVSPAELGRGLLVDHVLAFEAASLLLLGAIIGAAVIARRRDPGQAPEAERAREPAEGGAAEANR